MINIVFLFCFCLTVPWWCSARLALAFVGFLGFVNLYCLRVNMSVAMVCMINNTAIDKVQETVNKTSGSEGGDEQCVATSTNSTRKVRYIYKCQ